MHVIGDPHVKRMRRLGRRAGARSPWASHALIRPSSAGAPLRARRPGRFAKRPLHMPS
jgi:hypothetical protein